MLVTNFRTPEKKRDAEAEIRVRVAVLDDLDSDERERTAKRCLGAVTNGQDADKVNVERVADSVRSKRGPGNPERPKRVTTSKGAW